MELLQRMTHRSHKQMNRLVRKIHHLPRHSTKHESSAETNVHVGSGEYVMDIAIGTPSLTFPAIIDTGSDLIWTQCKPCGRCFSQPTLIFDPSTSSTYKRLPCTAKLCKALPYYKSKGPIQSTPLLKNPIFPFYYYLSLLGITVGTTKLDIPSSTFALNSNGTGGMIIDSSTSITYLEMSGYNAVKRADLALPESNYFIHDSDTDLFCLTVMGSSGGMSILGSMQQENFKIIYDTNKSKLSFIPTQCDQL
ncbi:aspartic proteinase nepenthesin-1-like [Carex rostrata]